MIHQTIAILKGLKTQTEKLLTETHHALAKNALLSGVSKTYAPKKEDGDLLPSEGQRVQLSVPGAIETIRHPYVRLFDEQMTLDRANADATADVVVAGRVLISDAPVTFLLAFSKYLTNLVTFIDKLPTLDTAKDWVAAPEPGIWQTVPRQTVRALKIPFPFEKSPATDKFPAQVEIAHRDEIVGTWTTIEYSGALPVAEQLAMLGRIRMLQEATNIAIMTANAEVSPAQHIGSDILAYVFGA